MKPDAVQSDSRPERQKRHSPHVSMMYGLTRSPGRPPGDPFTDLHDLARDLDPEDVRERDREARNALSDVDVEVVERARPIANEHLARPRPRVVDLLDAQDVRMAELAKKHGSHAIDLRLQATTR